ncbi:hypothetical protein [Blastopirellula marina]|uniref:Leucine Rich repeats (2 copies) n=1 Tax=Blastopirellula marina TaxID=124 RepID=A0A2S8GIB5_9BACT|nr:hypothetical protein [Blastopirellula marina]PQO44061.1 hypothetical protein C5Y93_21205 [Blastopirellula marina]
MRTDQPPPTESTSPTARRGWRFSLRTLLIAMPILGLLLGWIANEKLRHDKDQAAAERIRSRFNTVWSGENGRWNVLPPRIGDLILGRLYLPKTGLLIRGTSFDQPCEFEETDWEALENLTALESLDLNCFRGSPEGATFSRLHALKRLELNDCELPSNDLRQIVGLSQLTRLTFTDFEKRQVLSLARSPIRGNLDEPPSDSLLELKTLDIAPGSWPHMRTLHLRSYQLPDRSFQALSEIDSLETLWIANCDFEMRSLDQLAALPNLKELIIRPNLDRRMNGRPIPGANADEKTLAHWGRMQRLEKLQLSCLELENFGGVGQNLAQRWPRLTRLSIDNSTLSPQVAHEILAIPNLEFLSLGGSSINITSLDDLSVTEALLQKTRGEQDQLYSLIGDVLRLKTDITVTLSGEQVDDQAMIRIAAIDQLTSLTLRNTQVTDRGIAQLENHPALKHLSVEHCPLTNRSLASIARIPSLTYRNCELKETHVNGRMLEYLRGMEIEDLDVSVFLKAQGVTPAEPLAP